MTLRSALAWVPAVGAMLFMSSCSQEPTTLRLNLDENYKATTTSELDMTVSITNLVNNETKQMDSKMEFALGIEGMAPSEAGNQMMKMTIGRVQMDMVMDTIDIKYDSDNVDHELSNEEQTYHSMVGSVLEMELTDRGNLLGIANMESFVDNMIEKMGYADSAQAPMIKAMMMNQMSGDQIQSQFGLNNMSYPEEAVEVGSTWVTDVAMQSVMPLNVVTTYTVTDITETTVVVSSEGLAEVAEGGMPGIEINGTMNGTMTIDRATGWIQSSEGTMDFTSHINMGTNNMEMKIGGGYKMGTTVE